jgi:prepilin-type N-terminal cleavage/methylation domain-containing protein
MKNLIKKDTRGFTIIEVLIVLAIAGLIMLIVFLAVPALQRNSRNTQRANDASRALAAINECLSNNSGNLANCNNPAGARLNNYLNIGNNQQLTNWNAGAPPATPALDTFYYQTNTRCNDNNPVAGGGPRAFTIAYGIETTGNPVVQCVGS